MTVGEEGRDKADDEEGREGVGAGHVWLNVCVCVVGQVFTFFLGCNCCRCVAAVVVVLLVVVVVATHFFFAATAIYCIFHLPCERTHTHTHTYLPHTHTYLQHTLHVAVKILQSSWRRC